MQKTFVGADRFYQVTYMADWQIIRDIAEASGTMYNHDGLQQMAAKEAEKAKKKQ
jgi:phosphonate transport system substrate-binding protein